MILAFPVLLLISLMILCIDGPPVIYREYRVGRGGEPFGQLKFRTLRPGVRGQGSVAPEDDRRITPLGRWLRRWRIDEFPQLANVIAGDMSLVGPRPLPASHAETLPVNQRQELLSVRPGLTDRAALLFLAEDAVLAGHADAEALYLQKILPAKTEIQLVAIRRWKLLEDLRLIALTAVLLWSRKQRRRSARELERLLEESPVNQKSVS